ncbi:hypothetical protein [Ligilactobacillus equi]|uniref:NHL repeat containing protein n=1 Tax=Ligilactobacillus equi DPC 6820 TaxID=1392007 RepID=V7HV87_9LACO|nr:hypothetical protein [Ligilactobacillus equi]ETA74144.1 NHL repeat containing protein [Ligilactobacillus equi DPC 6820]
MKEVRPGEILSEHPVTPNLGDMGYTFVEEAKLMAVDDLGSQYQHRRFRLVVTFAGQEKTGVASVPPSIPVTFEVGQIVSLYYLETEEGIDFREVKVV